MRYLDYIRNLFTNFRKYNFRSKYKQKVISMGPATNNKFKRKFSSIHRYTHTAKNGKLK